MIKALISSVSKNSIKLNPEFFTDDEKLNKWIGKEPATADAIKDAEKRLSVVLPDDVIDLYETTNGTSEILKQTFGGFVPIGKIDWLKNLQPETIEAYSGMGEAYVEALNNSIVIAGSNHPHSVFIIQPYGTFKNWRYWEFAHFLPGENEFQGIEKYLERLNNFLEDQIKNKAETIPTIDYSVLIHALQKQDWMTVYSTANGIFLSNFEFPKYQPNVNLYGLCLLATSYLGNQSHFITVLKSIPQFTKNERVINNPLIEQYIAAAENKLVYLKDLQEFIRFKPQQNPKTLSDIELQLKEHRKDLLKPEEAISKLDYQLHFLYEYGNTDGFIHLHKSTANYFDYLKSARVFNYLSEKKRALDLINQYMKDVNNDERIFEVYLDEVLFELLNIK
jgi:hypothetical protein